MFQLQFCTRFSLTRAFHAKPARQRYRCLAVNAPRHWFSLLEFRQSVLRRFQRTLSSVLELCCISVEKDPMYFEHPMAR